jgi:anaerobic glycerol-3-phosphate dehydrogenase
MAAAAEPLLAELTAALGLDVQGERVVATREGVLRRVTGADQSLLNLAPLAGKRVGVVDVPRDDWDAPLLTRSYAESRWARETGTRFELVPLDLLEKGAQRRVSVHDFAAGFERAERPGWLIEVLKANAGPDGWLFGPWLGIKRQLARELTKAVGVPVGEVTSPPGGAAGARFEVRRDALLEKLGVPAVRSQVLSVAAHGSGLSLRLAEDPPVNADALVLATGGVAAGGIELSGALSGAEPAGFQLAIGGVGLVVLRREPAGAVSSLFGVDLGARGLGLLERVGLPVDGDGRVSGSDRTFAAGDLLAPEPPSVASALVSGLAAGTRAAIARKVPLE